MITIKEQLELIQFPHEIKQHSSQFSLDSLNSFTNKFVKSLIAINGISNVQAAIDNDSNPNNPIINYLTCLMELGMLHELFYQSFASSNSIILNQRLEYLAWAINITVANNLKESGVQRIPSLENGHIYIYYTWNNMEIIIQRIMPIAKQIDGALPNEIRTFIENLIIEKLK
jgi:hypothetical protein